jgi:hypothetical protein
MQRIITCVCAAVIVLDVGFCGGTPQKLTPQQQTEFDNALKAAEEHFPAVEDGLADIEKAPTREALPELRALEDRFDGAVATFKYPIGEEYLRDNKRGKQLSDDEKKRLTDALAKRKDLEGRLRACRARCFGEERQRDLDEALRAAQADQWIISESLNKLEEPTFTGSLAPQLDQLDEKLAKMGKALDPVKSFLKSPTREQLSSKQEKALRDAVNQYRNAIDRVAVLRRKLPAKP